MADPVTVRGQRVQVTHFEGDEEVAIDVVLVADHVLAARAREDAAFARGYRMGYRTAGGWMPFPEVVDAAHARWVAGGRKTRLDEGRDG